MPLLMRLTDSEVEAIDGVVSQASDRIENEWCVLEEVSSSRLLIDEEALLPDLHVDPVHRDIQPGGDLRSAEQACVMGPSAALLAHLDAGATPDPPHGDRKHHVLRVGGTMAFAGECRGDFVIGDAITGEIEYPVTHFGPSRELGDGVDLHLDFEIADSAAAPDDPDQSNIVLATVEHDFVDEAAQ